MKHHHETVGCTVKETWCSAIAQGNYATWSGLTVAVARKYCPDTEETTMGAMSQSRKMLGQLNVQNQQQLIYLLLIKLMLMKLQTYSRLQMKCMSLFVMLVSCTQIKQANFLTFRDKAISAS